MNESSFQARYFLMIYQVFILSLNILLTEERIIYFGKCPLVFGSICDSSELKFYLYSRLHPKIPEYVEYKDNGQDNLTKSAYNSELMNKIIIHGYNSDIHLNVLQNVKDEYLSSKANIWMVNYPNLVMSPCYPFSVYNIKYVGKCIASFVERLKSSISTNSTKLDVHIIGFSLGGQVPNYIAQYLPFKLQRITGLDPAGPLFYTNIIHQRLDPSDAEFVDVIHTNAFFQGQVSPCGHVDYYVNGGVFQPGCTGDDKFNCYHSRAVEYFAESINTTVGFWSWRCPSFTEYIENKCKPKEPLKLMGAYADPESPGIYLVNTDSKSPYAKGKNILDLDEVNKASVGNNFTQLMNSINYTIPVVYNLNTMKYVKMV